MPKFRQPLRLPNHDYRRAGYYFVTVCTQGRECLFGDCLAGAMNLSPEGLLIAEAWMDLQKHYAQVALDHHVVMPNHFHGILILKDARDSDGDGDSRHGLPELIRAFKSFSARKVNGFRKTPGIRLWQRGYYEHVIRGESDYLRIAEYIENNPVKWSEDDLNPQGIYS